MGARHLVRTAGETLWSQLLDDLRRRIADQEFARGFPGELALAREYAVSRHTARAALARLREEGVVTADRGRSQRVVGPAEFQQRLGKAYSLFGAVEQVGHEQRSVVRTLDTRVDGLVAVRLGLEESTPLVYLERLRLAADQPLAIDRAWLPAKVAAPLLDVDFSHTALYTELDRRCGIRPSQGTETVSAVVPTPTERKLLGITDEPGVAALSLRRLSCFSGHAVEWRHTLVRGDRFSVTAEFRGADWCPA